MIGIALAMMILSIVSSGVIVARGLSSVYQELIEPVGDYISEQNRMAQKVEEVFAAADVGDVDAFYALFSESATDYEPDLKEQIQTFIDAYPGKPDSIVYFRTDSSGGSYPLMEADGKTVVQINGKFMFTKDGANYYCQLVFNAVDEVRPLEVGVKLISIQSELAACRDESWSPYLDSSYKTGVIFVQIENDEDIETRRIDGVPMIFERYGRTITEKELYDFLEESTSLSEFMAEFGEPNVDDGVRTYYYEIASYDTPTRYAKIVYDDETDEILDESSIIDENGFLNRPLLEERKMGDAEPEA